ncbi:UDP-N-acetylmuramoyl-L-alanine--D-glutamate ligase [Parvibium lacunae]|uniref:UDP-N-acetylmuramoylalanine--D-glutamate ligase n=1 Tax=Parvibium lacunae TaxID=1888893 RepID=A0A368L371_9BURK|nr:UDP-N-acetylmuramoyl-L-alanine--D-glutamate ligase [Parvibium lacunae]RCS57558.1 UDP-N-acetylmuramoyl-L-alanine--D-glutamate ligase [Parvibium lacunae]
MSYSENKVTLVVGLGESGLAMARWLVRQGHDVRVADTRPAPPQLETLQATLPTVTYFSGTPEASWFEGVQQVALSPGVAPTIAPWKDWLTQVDAAQIPVVGEIELFAQALTELQQTQGYAPKVIAITGTNGKTTTTSLTAHLLSEAGHAVCKAGNISPAALDALSDALEQQTLPAVWVLELSSFQLETTHTLQADVATILNLSQDHLDWHGSMSAYGAAKARIFGSQTYRVLNRQDEWVMTQAIDTVPWQSFGIDAPIRAGDLGVVEEQGMRWLVEAEIDTEAQEAQPKSRKKTAELPVPTRIKRLMPAEALQIRGLHNVANALAALLLCRRLDIPWAPLLRGLREYRGEPHRMECIGTLAGVEFIDDSKGTNVGATVAAITGLQRPIYLIAGGDGKGQDFTPLAAPIRQHAQAVFLIGRDAALLAETLADQGVPLVRCDSLPQATQQAFEMARTAQAAVAVAPVVLLSPACASLDMFRNYAHRAEVFREAYQELALAQGQIGISVC